MPIVSFAEWSRYLRRHPNAHLLQTAEWGELKCAFGWQAVRFLDEQSEAGAQILFRQLPLGFTMGYLPKGPVPVPEAPSFWDEVRRICQVRRAVFLKIELDFWENSSPAGLIPAALLYGRQSMRRSRHNIQPPRTIVVDIRGSEDSILGRMKQKTRYNIRLAEKKKVSVRAWGDLESFHRMLLTTGTRDGFGVHTLEYYRRAYELLHPAQIGELLLAEYAGEPLAALFVARHGNRAYYLYGASTNRERNRMPSYLLQWEAMKWAKTHGCEEYDLWGVPDEEEAILERDFETRSDGLWGVYRFKRGFGGEVKRSLQALDQVFHPLLYQVYLQVMRNREA